jgi:hypothetical protein
LKLFNESPADYITISCSEELTKEILTFEEINLLSKTPCGNDDVKREQTNEVARKHLQDEILFLERELLPIVLRSSALLHSEIARYSTRCYDEAIRYQIGNIRCNGLLLYLPSGLV